MRDTTIDLATLWEKFSLFEEEEARMVILERAMDPMIQRGHSCLVGKLLTNKYIKNEIFKTLLIRIWKPNGIVTFKKVGSNLYLIELEH